MERTGQCFAGKHSTTHHAGKQPGRGSGRLKETQTKKRIRDPLYGFIRVDREDLRLIDHRIVQRLRWISQLPLEQLVYPSAQHSRFEHSLGTMHLAGVAAGSLLRNSMAHFQEACAHINTMFEISRMPFWWRYSIRHLIALTVLKVSWKFCRFRVKMTCGEANAY